MFKQVWGQDSPLRRWAIFETVVIAVVGSVTIALHGSTAPLYVTALVLLLVGSPITSYLIRKDPRWGIRRDRDG